MASYECLSFSLSLSQSVSLPPCLFLSLLAAGGISSGIIVSLCLSLLRVSVSPFSSSLCLPLSVSLSLIVLLQRLDVSLFVSPFVVLQNSDGSFTFVLALLARDMPRLFRAADTRAGFPPPVVHVFAELAVRYLGFRV